MFFADPVVAGPCCIEYENADQVGDNMIDCSNGRPTSDPKKVCRFSLNRVPRGACVFRIEYGYEDGTPCIVLKLNRIYGWTPEPLDSLIEQLSSGSGSGSGQGNESKVASTDAGVEIECHGENDVDQENIGYIDYQPYNFLPRYYFPYLGQDGYRDPLVFAMFMKPARNVVIMVECVAKAKNLHFQGPDRVASVKFELLID